jgi:4-amino-4-deoxy-L-arabinose transferase-like glycosyltransferase
MTKALTTPRFHEPGRVDRAEQDAPAPERLTLQWQLLAVALCVLLRLPFLTSPLNIDEGGDALIARAWGNTHGSVYGQYWLDRPPLLLLLYRIGLLGGDVGIRLLGMVCAALIVVGSMQLARMLAGVWAAKLAGLMAATLTASVLMGAVFTNSELIACVPSLFSLVALMASRRSAHPLRWIALAGFLAGIAPLIKQSFLDAIVAGVVFLLVSLARRSYGLSSTRWASLDSCMPCSDSV